MNKLIILILLMISTVGVAEDNWLSEKVVTISNKDGVLQHPLLKIDKEGQLVIDDGNVIGLKGVGFSQAEEKVREALGESYKSSVIKFIDVNSMVRVTFLGDLDEPGSYFLPKNTPIDQVQHYLPLFENRLFVPNYSVIRSGTRKTVLQEGMSQFAVQGKDIVMVSLTRKKIPDPVVKKEIEPVLKASEKQEASQSSEAEEVKASSIAANQNSEKKDTEDKEKKLVKDEVKKAVKDEPIQKQKSNLAEASKGGLDKYNTINVLRDYTLQPGDILRIDLPGEEGFNKEFLITREGEISLPEVGLQQVAGKTLGETEKLIYKELSSVFLGLDKLSVFLKEKRLLVTVLGYVNNPGEVELSSSGNIQTAINAAGGLRDGAQLDKLQLRREGAPDEFNYKRYLDTGDPALIPELKSLDVIFIPSSPQLGNVHGETATPGAAEGMDPTQDRTALKVFGEVMRPSTFPFKEGINVVDALLRSGGVTRYANVEQIRIIDNNQAKLFDLKRYLDNGDEEAVIKLSKGATVFVPKQVDAVKAGGRVVYVMGQVQKPGAFETGEEVGFLDVLANAGGPNRYADTRMVRILRTNGDVVPFNLQDYAEGEGVELPAILAGDAIFIPEKGTEIDRTWLKLPTNKSIHLLGAVNKPGRYEYSETITFMDLLAHAGGPNKRADLNRIKIIESGKGGQAVSREFNLEHFLAHGGNWTSLPKLSGGSTIVFPELPESPTDNKANWVKLSSDQSIYIMGAVVAPGRYAFNRHLDLLDILSAAEGPKDEADLTNVRIIHRNGSAPRVSTLNLVNYFETGDETLLPSVEVGDTIFIPSRNRSWTEKKQEQTIRIMGAVNKSGRYEFNSEMSILDLLAEAGGPTKTAYIEKIIIVNASDYKNQAHTFDLIGFMKDPDASKLPIIRPGDTVFIPDVSNTQFAYFMDALKDVLSIVSLVSLTKSLISGSAL
ncbi:polysaccharide biosynthesis/export family protein [Endozoicomonas arenosclerae]|uniref:polysaccharide biosynthesis/export family protein n=1 Tax=Endozoicomonas arenosclerae TaxID=1633495 RepID=UPI000785BAB7|nr:SLBB domain-containing protein [Endozoicomonas arenosclerae]